MVLYFDYKSKIVPKHFGTLIKSAKAHLNHLNTVSQSLIKTYDYAHEQ